MEEIARLHTLHGWLADVGSCDFDEIVADGGITAGMVVQQESREQARRLYALLTAAEARAAPQPQAEVERLREAAIEVLSSKSDTYRQRNGRHASIEGDDGEKCWIVPFDAIVELDAALAALTTPDPKDAA